MSSVSMETGRKHAVRVAKSHRNWGTSAAVFIKCKQQQAPKHPARSHPDSDRSGWGRGCASGQQGAPREAAHVRGGEGLC